jgi:hypothetical protein
LSLITILIVRSSGIFGENTYTISERWTVQRKTNLNILLDRIHRWYQVIDWCTHIFLQRRHNLETQQQEKGANESKRGSTWWTSLGDISGCSDFFSKSYSRSSKHASDNFK